jgi:hypothetical protein
VASFAIACYAIPRTTSSAKPLIAIAPTFFFRIAFLLEMGAFFCQAVWVALPSQYGRTAGPELHKASQKFSGHCFAVSSDPD